MLFAPPVVKSLSRYSEFGSHLREKDFLMMVGLAVLLHIAFVTVYSMTPHEQTMIIPVRVLNIKLNAGGADGLDMPKPEAMPGYVPPAVPDSEKIRMDMPHERSAQVTADKIYSGNKNKPLISILEQNSEKRRYPKNAEALANDQFTLKPRKYVRESELSLLTKQGKHHGNGTTLAGTKEGRAIIERYEQVLSLWMEKHKSYPATAERLKIEGKPVVRIRITRGGHITYSAIDVSSGNALIDQAALAMVHDSDPVPPEPDDYPDHSPEQEFLIPVNFSLK